MHFYIFLTSQAKPSHVSHFGRASTTPTCFRSSRSLLRQVSKWAHVGTFLDIFSLFFLTSFFHRFFFDFGGVWEAKMRPKTEFWKGFWNAFLASSF